LWTLSCVRRCMAIWKFYWPQISCKINTSSLWKVTHHTKIYLLFVIGYSPRRGLSCQLYKQRWYPRIMFNIWYKTFDNHGPCQRWETINTVRWSHRKVFFIYEIDFLINSILFQSSRWAQVLQPKTSKTLFGPINFSVFI
jgi:hypothetical protein